jgi:hypothetical protein
VGLGKIGKKIVEIIEKVQAVVDKALDWLIDKAVSLGTAMLDKLKKGVAAVLGWFGLKKPAKTKDGVEHTLLFTGSEKNSVLTIQTTPMPVVDYINKVKTDNKLKDADVKAPLATAQKIDTEEKKKPTDDKGKQKQEDDIGKLMEQLAKELGELPITAATGVNSGANYGGVHGGAFGTSATVAFQKAPFVRGTSPNVDHPIYDKINARKDKGGSYYVKGHLLNDNLGGPGTVWTNLTPINRQANKDHQLMFEDKVKTVVNGSSAQIADTNSLPTTGTMKGFSVIAQYGRGEPAALTQLKSDPDDYPAGFDPGWNPKDVIDVLEGEKSVPTGFTCQATLTKKGETDGTPLSVPIQNNIDYGNLSSYQFGLRPTVKVALADLVNSTANESEALAALMTINGIGDARARKILAKFMSSKRTVSNGKSEIGIGAVALTGQNPGKAITWGSLPTSWPPAPPVTTPKADKK